jgi:hypothetical protein
LKPEVGDLALAPAALRVVERADLQHFLALLVAAADAFDAHAARVGRRAGEFSLGSRSISIRPRPPLARP